MITVRGCVVASLVLLVIALQTAHAAAQPNIVFFLVDDQRNTTLGVSGDSFARTPTIDKLARDGVRFTNAFVTTSICAASRASILTSLTERTHGYTFGAPPVSSDHIQASYPTQLKTAGYQTAFFGKFGIKIEDEGQIEHMFDAHSFRDRPYLRKSNSSKVRHIDELNTAEAIAFIDSTTNDKPFCLSVFFSSGHAEDSDKVNHYPSIPAVEGMFDDVRFPAPRLGAASVFDSQPEFLKNSMNRERFFWRWDTQEKYQKNMRGYYRLISGVDVMIRRALDALDQQGITENTVIIYAADNGYYMGDRGFAGKWSHYEESLRIPMIVYDPRQPDANRGRVSDEMVLNIDIGATILDLAAVDQPNHYQGSSLKPFMNGDVPPDWRTDFFVEHRMQHPKIPTWEGVRSERYVYARYDGQSPPYEFLQDLAVDPDQLKNFAGESEYESILSYMRTRCDALRANYVDARKTRSP